MKKLICLIVCICMLGTAAAQAAPPSYQTFFDVTSMGIIKGDETGDYGLDKSMTRGEFATVLVRLTGLSEVAQMNAITCSFSDVRPDDWFYKEVAVVVQMGLMNGTAATEFRPDETVTLEQVLKPLVIALGYGAVANQKGGYPAGYLTQAAEIGLLKNVKTNGEMTRGDLVTILYNSLDVPQMVQRGYGQEISYEIVEGQTWRNHFLTETSDGGTYHAKGIVSANAQTWLESPVHGIKENEVEIGGILYDQGALDCAGLIGQEVDFYAVKDASDQFQLTAVKPTKNNLVVEIMEEAIKSVSLREVSFYDESGYDQKVSICSNPKVVYNGKLLDTYNESVFKLFNGSMTLVDNNGDSAADILFINEYSSVLVKESKKDLIRFREGDTIKGLGFLRLETDNPDRQYLIRDAAGKTLNAEEIPAGAVLSVSSDKDGFLYRLTVSEEKAEGIVEEITDDELVIAGNRYPLENGKIFDVQPGDTVTVSLNFQGKAAGIKQDQTKTKYGYVVQAGTGGGISNKVQIKMLTGQKVQTEYEKNEQNMDDKNEIPILVCENESVQIFDVSEKVAVNGTSLTAAQAAAAVSGKLVEYTLNAAGELRVMDLPEFQGGGSGDTEALKYNVYDKTFGGNTLVNGFAIDGDTLVVCVPKEGTANDEDYMVQIRIDNKVSGRTFQVEGYDMDPDTKKVRVMVVRDKMDSAQVPPINIDTAKIGMVVKNSSVSNEAGELMNKMTILVDGAAADYVTGTITDRNHILSELQKGDLIYFVRNTSGKIENAEIIYSFKQGIQPFHKNVGQNNEQICGSVEEISYGELDNRANKLVANTKIVTPGGGQIISITQRNAPPVFIYESSNKDITAGTIYDIIPENQGSATQLLYAIMPQGKVKACVIIR